MRALAVGLLPLTGFAQIPAGQAYDPERHPNPIVTFVEAEDFQPASYDEARRFAGIELMGLSAAEGVREEIAVAPGRAMELRVLGRRTETLSFPVVRQTFGLTRGGVLRLYSFRNPRTDLPSDAAEEMLDQDALTEPRNPGEGRFGPSPRPDSLSIRGKPALLFGNAGERSLFWQEDRVSHVAVADIEPEDLFRIVEDLL